MYMLEQMTFIWLGAAVLLLLAEAATVGLAAIWFALGALVAIIPAALDAPLWVQILVFLVVSAAALVFTRPFVRRVLKVKGESTNADAVIGKIGVVLEAVDNLAATGRVRANGLEWTARSEDDTVIPAESRVEVLRIEGVKLIVRPYLKP